MKPLEVFEKLVQKAIGYCMRYPSVRRTPDKYQGTPGELLKHLSDEEKEALANLKSDEVNTVPEKQAAETTHWTPRTDLQHGYDVLKDEKQKFDKRMKK